ncbi:MAG: phosphate signaling complex protein PhoU [Proteobacteria bacterium]|nr:phosphate signaling complex protein PhoU [Pseudomonadota bacterium]HQR04548.1 phosphate signaling complex protein PhoU [Rhodocyclaceae bacterium]
MNTEHFSKQFDTELDELRSRVMEMGGLVEIQIRRAIDAFFSGDLDRIEEVIDDDHRINGLEVSIDDDCAHIIARRQPAASDLRLVMAVSRIVTDLERIGDEAAKIARMAREVYRRDRLVMPRLTDVRKVGEIAAAMLRDVLNAFVRLDAVEAARIVREDLTLDDNFRSILRQLITYMMEDPRTISTALDIVFIAKSIERIGDHATNVAESVIYVVKGKDVRHIAIDQLEREALAGGH